MGARKKLLFLVSEDWYFCSHRLPLARAALAAGYDVAVATRVHAHGEKISEAGLRLLPIRLSRGGGNPFRDLASILELVRLYRWEKPDIVHHVAMKPVLYGSLAARLTGVPTVVNALAGMGYLFTSDHLKAAMLRPFVVAAFRVLLNRPGSRLILQNPDDRALLVRKEIVEPEQVSLIRGSGVDLTEYAVQPLPSGIPMVVLPARMLWDKGVGEFVGAARRLKARGVVVRMVLVGGTDPVNPAAIPEETLEAWQKEGMVEWWGRRDDMPAIYGMARVVCLPSYREGLPKALIEGAACGRPLVATDVPGCREVVTSGDNGFLVPARDEEGLETVLVRLLTDEALCARMGARSRARAETEFAVEQVVAETLEVYREMTS